MNRDEEIELIKKVIGHPAAFNIGLFALLSIRSHCDGYEVAWGENSEEWKNFTDLQEAVEFFVDKRYELELGLDIEAKLMKEKLHE